MHADRQAGDDVHRHTLAQRKGDLPEVHAECSGEFHVTCSLCVWRSTTRS